MILVSRSPEAMAAATGQVKDGVWAGGDVLNLGLATIAVGQGRIAALALRSALCA